MPIPATLHLVRRVAEDSEADTLVGSPVEAYDDDGDTLTYELGGTGTDPGNFTIVRGSGQIRVKQGTTLQYDGSADPKRTYNVVVTASDPLGKSATVSVGNPSNECP